MPETVATTPYMMRPTPTPRTGCGLAMTHSSKNLLSILWLSVKPSLTKRGEGDYLFAPLWLTKLTPKKEFRPPYKKGF